MAKQLINSLQVFRRLAALAVVVHHASVSTDAFVETVPASWFRLFSLGALGVDFFFVLSGFIIMHAHMQESSQPAAIKSYIAKRLARIFPAYWPIGLTLLGLYAALPGMSASGGREFSYVSSILLLPADLPPALSVAWSLVHELLFYGVFMLWFITKRAFWFGLFLWAAVILAVTASGGSTGWLRYLFSMLNLEFMMGVVAATIYCGASQRYHAGIFVAWGSALAIAMLMMMHSDKSMVVRLGFALGLAVLMLGVACWEQCRAICWPVSLLALGNGSYSIYLVHNPLVSMTQRLAGRLGMTWPLALLLGVVLSIVCGYLYFLWLERPALRFFRSGGKTPKSRTSS